MNRTHGLVIALAVAIAAVAGTFAAVRSTQLSAATPSVPAAEIAKQNRRLDRAEASLRAQARRRPPALGAVPTAEPAPTVIYRRPPAIVRVVHHRGEHEEDDEEDGEDGEGGAELDD
jgi:hypothetical protein